MRRYLSTRLLHSDISAEVDPELVGRFSCLRKILNRDDGSYTEFDGFEFLPSDSFLHGGIIGENILNTKKSSNKGGFFYRSRDHISPFLLM